MTVSPNPNTSQVRDLNRVLDWLDEMEDGLTKYYPELYVPDKDGDLKARFYRVIYFNCLYTLYQVAQLHKPEDEDIHDYLASLPLLEYVIVATVTSELKCQDVSEQAGLEDSQSILDINEFLPTLIRDLIQQTVDVDVNRLADALYTPVSAFAIPTDVTVP